MGWIILFVLSTALVVGFVLLAFNTSKETDEQYKESGMSKNQIRALAWFVGIAICILAALIEWFIVVRNPDEETGFQPTNEAVELAEHFVAE